MQSRNATFTAQKDNLQQSLFRISMLELLVDGYLEGKITLPLHHYPFQLVEISALIHRANPVLPLYYVIYLV